MISASRPGCARAAALMARASSGPARSDPAGSGSASAGPACTVRARPMRVAAFSRARSTWSAWISAVSLVTCAVTNGLPSRSAPTQLPNRRNAGAAAGACPDAGPCSARSSERYRAGTTRKSDSSNAAMAVRTSSSGRIACTRSAAVRHSRSISSRSLRVASACSLAPSRPSSRLASSTLIRRRISVTARRRVSVGWAVSTGCTRRPASRSSVRSGPSSPRTAATVAASDSRGAASPVSRWRSVRIR